MATEDDDDSEDEPAPEEALSDAESVALESSDTETSDILALDDVSPPDVPVWSQAFSPNRERASRAGASAIIRFIGRSPWSGC